MKSIKSNYSQKLNNFFFLLLTTLITLFIFIPSCTRTVYKNFHAQTATNVRSSLPTRLTSNFYTNYPSARYSSTTKVLLWPEDNRDPVLAVNCVHGIRGCEQTNSRDHSDRN